MNVLRKAEPSDLPFLKEMLYEAVYWRAIAAGKGPSLEDGLAVHEVRKSLDGFGDRDGDKAYIALAGAVSAGAAWYRFWSDTDYIRGYVEPSIPVLVLAVHHGFRRQGIGHQLLTRLLSHASKQGIAGISLMVSKDNPALYLYQKCGFLEYADKGDSLLMVHRLEG